MLSVFTTTIVFAIAQVTASNLSEALQASRLQLHARQVNDPISVDDFPLGCQALCTPAVEVVNDPNCQTSRCQCTEANTIALGECLGCSAVYTGRSLTAAQADVQSFINQCAKDGFPVGGFPATGAPTRSTSVLPRGSATSARFSPPASGASDVRETPTSAGASPPQNTIAPSNVPSGLPVIGNGAFVPRVRGGGAVLVTVMPVLALLQYI
ncbi:hypothetical protein PLEOSDRAFT_1114749 [Pleurotus ostreatus PC15]|uniref:Extracellular membrane protein CFEM domain-containing protein n=2 Tax=Pleurotus TaxID=5320 RepID=A0A067N7I4_PLEO1|nr:hypothetical protein CCMSSC00406_0006255 [Pleurotus cornucopiae]KDQ22910.1 hypothetical protein PLEOSDRAFT_1114749 [Pleurotus ostreatus PC15]